MFGQAKIILHIGFSAVSQAAGRTDLRLNWQEISGLVGIQVHYTVTGFQAHGDMLRYNFSLTGNYLFSVFNVFGKIIVVL